MKKLLVILMVLCIITTMLAGCTTQEKPQDQNGNTNNVSSANNSTEAPKEAVIANFNPTGFPIVNDKITLTAVIRKGVFDGEPKNWAGFNEYEKRTNIHIEFNQINEQMFLEKKDIMLASGDLPDLFLGEGLTQTDELKYGPKGFFISLNDMIDKYGENLKALDQKYPGLLKEMTTPDGNIYSFANLNKKPEDNTTYRAFINVQWLNEAGVKKPTNLDEFYTALMAFKARGENIIPYAGVYSNNYNLSPVILNSLGLAGYGPYNREQITNYLGIKDGKVYFTPAHEHFTKYLEYMNKLYTEKLIDQDYYAVTEAQMKAQGAEMRIGSFIYSAAHTLMGADIPKISQYEYIEPLTSDVNNEKVFYLRTGMSKTKGVITNANKYPEASVRLIDYWYSDAGSDLFRNGVGITDPDYVPGWKWSNDAKTETEPVIPEGYSSPMALSAATLSPFSTQNLPHFYPTDFAKKGKYNDAQKHLFGNIGKFALPYAQYAFPSLYLSEEEQREINLIASDIMTYVAQMEAKFVMSVEPLSNVNEYYEQLKALQVEKIVQIYQQAYDR